MRRSWRPLPVLSLLIFLVGTPAAAQPVVPCGACLAIVVDADQVSLLPPDLAGLEILVRSPSLESKDVDEHLRTIASRGGTPGLLIEDLAAAELSPSSSLRTVILRVPAAPADPATLAFDVKTRLTNLRARLRGPVRVGLSASDATLRALRARDAAAYADFVVSPTPPPSTVSWWKDAGELAGALAGMRQQAPHSERSLWYLQQRGQAFARTMADLAAAARLAPRGLVPSDNVTVACSGANAGVWLDPSAPGYVAIVERCNPAELRIAPSTMTMTDVAALADGSLIVRIADPSSTRVAEGVNVSAKRTLTLAEIMARHQAAAARQADAISTRISTGSLTLTFEAPSFPAPMTIASRVVMFADGELVEIEQQDIRVNGLAFGGGRVPRLPIIEPERVASVPLAIELTDVYRYALAGTQTMEGTLCYVVRFAPAAGGRTLFRGTAWIAADDFGLVKVAATQVGLRGPIVSSDQVDTFARVDGVWLLRESRVNQIYEGAAHRTPIERVMTLDRTDVDPVNFESRRASAYASPNVMVRDTPQGYRYLRRGDPDERREPLAVPAIALERPATRVRTVALGMIADPNISHPLPFAGLSYVDFDLFGTGTQFNGFFGGTFGQMAFSMPSVAGSRWQIAGRAFAIASSFNDRSFDGGLERYEENIRQRPAQASVWALRPLTPRVTLRVAYDFEYLHYSRADTTAPAFVVPASQTVHAARFAIEGQRHGWTASAWWSPAVRQRWRVWGDAGGDHYDPGHRDFQRYGASLARSTVVTPALVARGEIAWQDGHHLDRFSRYSFGAFDNRLRGYPGALIRYDRGAIARGAIGWSAAPRLRIDGFADAAFVRDPGFDPEPRPYTGLGLAVESPAPFGTLVAAEWGYGIQGRRADGRRGTHVVRISAYKIF